MNVPKLEALLEPLADPVDEPKDVSLEPSEDPLEPNEFPDDDSKLDPLPDDPKFVPLNPANEVPPVGNPLKDPDWAATGLGVTSITPFLTSLVSEYPMGPAT